MPTLINQPVFDVPMIMAFYEFYVIFCRECCGALPRPPLGANTANPQLLGISNPLRPYAGWLLPILPSSFLHDCYLLRAFCSKPSTCNFPFRRQFPGNPSKTSSLMSGFVSEQQEIEIFSRVRMLSSSPVRLSEGCLARSVIRTCDS